MFYHDRIATDLLQLFAHPENTKCYFCIVSDVIFEAHIVSEQKKACW